MVTGSPRHGAAVARRAGFLERIAIIAPDAVITEANGNFEFEAGIAAGRQLLDVADRPTAIFATNDDSAAGVMTACTQLGIAVPDAVSICGFDDNFVAKRVWPYLTTVYQPIAELARQAANLLLDRRADNRETANVLLAHRMVERDTIRDLRVSEKVRRPVKGDDDA
nr:substrate-binding domain-containing protein [Aurantiacibacter xanthus]